jgi:hypothetical protein
MEDVEMRPQIFSLSDGSFVAIDPEHSTVKTSRDATTWTQLYPATTPSSGPETAKQERAPRVRPATD